MLVMAGHSAEGVPTIVQSCEDEMESGTPYGMQDLRIN